MAINIKNTEAEKLVAEVTRTTKETKTKAIIVALQERLERLRGRRRAVSLDQALREISKRCAELPDHDTRSADEILQYSDNGTFEE